MIATIVADTMDGYIMFGRSLKCKVIPSEKVHPKTFRGSNRRFFPKRTKLIHRKLHNTPKTPEALEKSLKKLKKRNSEKEKKLKDLGITYQIPEIQH